MSTQQVYMQRYYNYLRRQGALLRAISSDSSRFLFELSPIDVAQV